NVAQDQVPVSNRARRRLVPRAPVSQPCTSRRRILRPPPLPGFPALFERLSCYRPRVSIFLPFRATAPCRWLHFFLDYDPGCPCRTLSCAIERLSSIANPMRAANGTNSRQHLTLSSTFSFC